MAKVGLKTRIGLSLVALGVTWFLSGIGFSIYCRDARALVAFLIWSVPFFALGWVTVGVPTIAWRHQIPAGPGFPMLLGLIGALAGGTIMLTPGALARWISPDSHFAPFTVGELAGWPSFGAAIGATAMLFYSWLLSLSREDPSSQDNIE